MGTRFEIKPEPRRRPRKGRDHVENNVNPPRRWTALKGVVNGLVVEPPEFPVTEDDLLAAGVHRAAAGAAEDDVVTVADLIVFSFVDVGVNPTVGGVGVERR